MRSVTLTWHRALKPRRCHVTHFLLWLCSWQIRWSVFALVALCLRRAETCHTSPGGSVRASAGKPGTGTLPLPCDSRTALQVRHLCRVKHLDLSCQSLQVNGRGCDSSNNPINNEYLNYNLSIHCYKSSSSPSKSLSSLYLRQKTLLYNPYDWKRL